MSRLGRQQLGSPGGGGGGAPQVPEPLWVPAARWAPAVTNGAIANSREVGGVRVLDSFDFVTAATRTITVQVSVPASWSGTEISVALQWSTASGTAAQFVRWSASARWMADGDAESAAFGTAQTVDDAIGAVDTWRDSAATPAITPAGTAGQKVISIQLQRLGASDDAPGSARGLGLWINWL